jgi:hypothetical protein
MWFWLSELPSGEDSHCPFAVDMPLLILLKLSLTTDGKLKLISSSNGQPAVFTTSSIRKSRWTHIALVRESLSFWLAISHVIFACQVYT